MSRLLSLFCILTTFAAAGDRDLAQWIIRQGGQVMLNGGKPIGALADLPDGDFQITGVDLYGTPTVPKDLERLSALTELRELYLNSKTYSPSSDKKGDFADDSLQA